MAQTFSDYRHNSQYLQGFSAFTKQGIFVYVEDESDISFWINILGKGYSVKVYSKKIDERLEKVRGKAVLLKLAEKGLLNEQQRIAIDADIDYLCPNYRYDGKIIQQHGQYIYHTFVYGRESIVYSHNYLNYFVKNKLYYTHDVELQFDFTEFVELYSKLCYRPLTCFLYLKEYQKIEQVDLTLWSKYKSNCKSSKKASDFWKCFFVFDYLCDITDLVTNELKINHYLVQKLMLDIDDFCDSLSKSAFFIQNEYQSFIKQLNERELSETNACYFINAHIFEDEIIKPIFTKLKAIIHQKEIDNVINQDVSRKNAVINHYNRQFSDLLISSALDFLLQDSENLFLNKIKHNIS